MLSKKQETMQVSKLKICRQGFMSWIRNTVCYCLFESSSHKISSPILQI